MCKKCQQMKKRTLLRDKCHQRRGRWHWYRSVSWVLCWVLSRVLKFQHPEVPDSRLYRETQLRLQPRLEKKIPLLIGQSLHHDNDCCTIDNECENTLDGEDGASEPAFALRHVGFGWKFISALFSIIHLSLAYRGKQRPPAPGVENPEGKGVLKKEIVSKNMTHCRFWCWSFHLDHCLYCHLFGDLAPDK